LQDFFFLLTVHAFAPDLVGRGHAGFLFFLLAGGAFALDLHGTGGRYVREAHAHHLVRNGVGFRLEWIGEGANPQLLLN
jgi:hypothetical protein